MAVTTRTYTINPYWVQTDVLTTLQTALEQVGYHAAAQTGTIYTFTNSGGGTIAAEKYKRYLVSQSSTSGTGVYAAFDVVRSSTGAIGTVTLVRGGKNYAATNTITILGTSIGGATPADDLTITVSTVSASQGTTTTWYDTDASTWGVCCVNNNEASRLGQTYYSFHIPAITTFPTANPTLYMRAGPGFNSNTNTFTGVSNLDYYATNNSPADTTRVHHSLVLAASNATTLTLTTYQSAIDPSFVIFQFSDESTYGKSYRAPFFLSKYSNSIHPWSLNDCFTGAIYSINTSAGTYDGQVVLFTNAFYWGKRQGEWGYTGGLNGSGAKSLSGIFEGTYGKKQYLSGNTSNASTIPQIYNRTVLDGMQNSLIATPVVTGIPISTATIPVPYFLPADVGIAEISATNTTSVGDLLSIGATTKWKVIQPSVNTLYYSATGFVVKTVD